jgi:hypothetical protein
MGLLVHDICARQLAAGVTWGYASKWEIAMKDWLYVSIV